MATKILSSRQGLVCGEWKCENEAKGIPSDLDVRLAAFDNADAEFIEQKTAEAVACGVHIGAAKRRQWDNTEYVPITDAQRETALRHIRAVEAMRASEQDKRREANHQQAIASAARRWRELDDESEYTVVYEEVPKGFSSSKIERRWSIYDALQIAAAKEEGRDLSTFGALAGVAVGDSDVSWEDVTYPAYVQTSISSAVTPKLAVAIAEALVKAAVVVGATNVPRRKVHDSQTHA